MTKKTAKKKPVARARTKSAKKKTATLPTPSGGAPPPLSKLPIDELRAAYQAIVGRETGSDNRSYLMWKIREAKKGNIRVGPPLRREPVGPQQVLSLRIDADAVPVLDAAWKKHGMKSRVELVRRALHRELDALGEREAAARFDSGHDAEG